MKNYASVLPSMVTEYTSPDDLADLSAAKPPCTAASASLFRPPVPDISTVCLTLFQKFDLIERKTRNARIC